MPIQSYGALLGRFTNFNAENKNNQGKYRHGLFKISVNGIEHICAVDVDTQDGAVPVHWAVVELRSDDWVAMLSRSDGWYGLNKTDTDGSIDYIRDPRLSTTIDIDIPDLIDPFWKLKRKWWFDRFAKRLFKIPEFDFRPLKELGMSGNDGAPVINMMSMRRKLWMRPTWHVTQSEEALAALQSITADESNCRMLFFGSFFTTGKGVHNIHQNQGNFPPTPNDPDYAAKLRHYQSNGIWQDGITIAIRQNGQMFAFLNKFGVQSDQTDGSGNGI